MMYAVLNTMKSESIDVYTRDWEKNEGIRIIIITRLY